MNTILENEAVANLPVAELENELETFLRPVSVQLPEERLRRVGKLAVQGIIAGQSPMVTQMARGVIREGETIWPMAKRLYRFIWNKRFNHRDLLKGLFSLTCSTGTNFRRLPGCPGWPPRLRPLLACRRGLGGTCGPSLEGGCEELCELRLTCSRKSATSASNACTWPTKISTNACTACGVCAHSAAEKGICSNSIS